MTDETSLDRRGFLKVVGAAGAGAAAPLASAQAQTREHAMQGPAPASVLAQISPPITPVD